MTERRRQVERRELLEAAEQCRVLLELRHERGESAVLRAEREQLVRPVRPRALHAAQLPEQPSQLCPGGWSPGTPGSSAIRSQPRSRSIASTSGTKPGLSRASASVIAGSWWKSGKTALR